MKPFFIIAIFFTFCNFSYSQKNVNKPTRQQTETWLLEKISKYLQKEDYYSIDDNITNKNITGSKKNIKLKMKDDCITITMDVEERVSNKFMIDGIDIKTRNYIETYTIPLKDLTNKEFIDQGYLVFRSNYNSFITTRSDSFKTTTSVVLTKIDSNEEQDFSNRFNKAMNHLLSYIKKSKTTELF